MPYFEYLFSHFYQKYIYYINIIRFHINMYFYDICICGLNLYTENKLEIIIIITIIGKKFSY